MFGNMILILPFGVLPLILFLVWAIYLRGSDAAQDKVGSKIRKGITEFPLELSACLFGTIGGELEFTDDGRSIIWTTEYPSSPLEKTANPSEDDVKNWIKELVGYDDGFNPDWVDSYQIEKIEKADDASMSKVTISIDDEVAQSEGYIAHEIKHMGRVFQENTTTNKHRSLMYSSANNKVRREGAKLMVYVDRTQTVPTFLDGSKSIVMSEKQISRNIANRLWNRVEVKCIGMDKKQYRGEIVGF